MKFFLCCCLYVCSIAMLSAGEPAKAPPPKAAPKGPKRIPPEGVPIPPETKTELEAGLKSLDEKIAALRTELKAHPKLLELLPDVEIYARAVRVAVQYEEFFDPKEFATAKTILKHGEERADALKTGTAPWTAATGLVVRAYVSKLDGSIIPYGLVVPANYKQGEGKKHRLDVWLHGRDEKLTELKFLNDREKSAGEFTPEGAFVLHSYGRFCNAFKFAGEVDIFEALEHAKTQYPIDEDRLVIRGFSMGGAGCWQAAVHHPYLWAAAAPGAGFSETPKFSRVENWDPQPPEYERTLWRWYDAQHYALNIFNLPTVAYSGENDRQKQAADVMAEAAKAEGIELTHIIGPKTEHKYHPDSKKEINDRIDPIVAKGRVAVPSPLKFTTYTLRYYRSHWINLDGLDKHWEKARVEAEITTDNAVRIKVENVSALTIDMPAEKCPLTGTPKVVINDQTPEASAVNADKSWKCSFAKVADRWVAVKQPDTALRKKPGLQGPIDDAFLESFLYVKPTGTALNPAVGKWAQSEMERAQTMWRSQFRGDARVTTDAELTDAQIAANNLVLWGDPSSNKVLARIVSKLPILWTEQSILAGASTFPSSGHALVMIFPNPLNPIKYVVLNSGFTFRENAMASNALQNPVLPDYAVIDLATPPGRKWPGGIAKAGFFNEKWELKD